MKMEIPLPCLYPSPFLNKPTHSYPSSSTLPHYLPLSLSLSPLHSTGKPSAVSITPSFPTSSTSFSNSSILDNSASIPLSLTPTHTPTHNQFLQQLQHAQDSHLKTTHTTQRTQTTHTQHTPNNATIKSVLDSSIMASSMDIVRAWRHRRCIDVDFVLGCRATSNDAENVRYAMLLVLIHQLLQLSSCLFHSFMCCIISCCLV